MAEYPNAGSGLSLDMIISLLGHQQIETTDRYITYDRLSYTDFLNTLPKINRITEKKTAINKSRSLNEEFGNNW